MATRGLVLSLLFISSTIICTTASSSRKGVSREALKEIDEKLRHLNKPAVKSIKSEDGDIIDCVDIYKQPAFDHPALKNHVIQMKPSYEPVEETETVRPQNVTSMHVSQIWRKSGSCPQGTVPIRRIRRRDLLRASSIDRFGMKNPYPYSESTVNQVPRTIIINDTEVKLGTFPNRSDAVLVTYGYNYIGGSAEINVWNPRVDLPDDYSSGQLWLWAGPGEETIEAGWIVNPKLYGNTNSRLFVHWTKDRYNTTGCFDLTCSGFIQTSSEVAVGAALDPVSSRWAQYYISVGIFLDTNTTNWWLYYGPNKTAIGYWPASELFYYLRRSAILVQWGGEVYSGSVQKSPHTGTDMGSGSFSQSLYGNAAYVNHPRIVDWSRFSKYPLWVSVYSNEVDCYNGYNYREGIVREPMFFYGGPGQNPHCP